MKFSKYILFSLFISLVVVGCNTKQQQEASSSELSSAQDTQAKTYAEIAVKSGGEWEGSEYVGGRFENVEELEVPQQHSDHSGYIKYEGPGWENSQVGYRLYLDWRNAIDIFGKKTDSMVLHGVGRENAPSYHDEAPWGMDILKAGQSLGIGGFGRFVADSVAHFRSVGNTKVRVANTADDSKVVIEYSDWVTAEDTIDLVANFTITPQDRFTKVELDPFSPIDNLVTGIVILNDIEVQQKESSDGEWGYIATYGKQTLVNDEDQLGMAIFYKTDEVAELKTGPHDHLVVFKPENDITYYFLAAWEQELDGITTQEAFISDLDDKLERLSDHGEL